MLWSFLLTQATKMLANEMKQRWNLDTQCSKDIAIVLVCFIHKNSNVQNSLTRGTLMAVV